MSDTAPSCPACTDKRQHSAEEWQEHHPYAGHGFIKETGWSHPDLEPKNIKANA